MVFLNFYMNVLIWYRFFKPLYHFLATDWYKKFDRSWKSILKKNHLERLQRQNVRLYIFKTSGWSSWCIQFHANIYILQSRQTLHFSCSVENILPATSTNKIAFPSRQTALSVQSCLLSSKHSTFQSVVYQPPFISGWIHLRKNPAC